MRPSVLNQEENHVSFKKIKSFTDLDHLSLAKKIPLLEFLPDLVKHSRFCNNEFCIDTIWWGLLA